jgi:hypothetical protein
MRLHQTSQGVHMRAGGASIICVVRCKSGICPRLSGMFTAGAERCNNGMQSTILIFTFFYYFLSREHKKNSVASVRKRTIPTERPPLVSEVSANFFADRRCHVVSVTNPYGRIFGFLDRSRYYFFQVARQLYSRGWVDPIPDQLLFSPF